MNIQERRANIAGIIAGLLFQETEHVKIYDVHVVRMRPDGIDFSHTTDEGHEIVSMRSTPGGLVQMYIRNDSSSRWIERRASELPAKYFHVYLQYSKELAA